MKVINKSQFWFNRLEEEIDVKGSWGNINPARLKAVLKFAGKTILDIGCSKGSYVKYLCEKGYDAYGIDVLITRDGKGNIKIDSNRVILLIFLLKTILLKLCLLLKY